MTIGYRVKGGRSVLAVHAATPLGRSLLTGPRPYVDFQARPSEPQGYGSGTDAENGGGFLNREPTNVAEEEDLTENGKQAKSMPQDSPKGILLARVLLYATSSICRQTVHPTYPQLKPVCFWAPLLISETESEKRQVAGKIGDVAIDDSTRAEGSRQTPCRTVGRLSTLGF